jgi:hypothetical protein
MLVNINTSPKAPASFDGLNSVAQVPTVEFDYPCMVLALLGAATGTCRASRLFVAAASEPSAGTEPQ